jgi:4-carboxymuconolactone decarboxylase
MANLPKTYLNIKERYPAYIAAVESLGETMAQAGPLDDKTVQLVQLAAAAAIHSEGSVKSHARRARKAGATEEEIAHALILLTSTIGFPTVAAALSWVEVDASPAWISECK